MPNFIKAFLVFIFFTPIAVIIQINVYNSILNFSINGEVVDIDWSYKGGTMPIILVEKNGRNKKFSSGRIVLNPETLKIGDQIRKEKGSLDCWVNSVRIKCIGEFNP